MQQMQPLNLKTVVRTYPRPTSPDVLFKYIKPTSCSQKSAFMVPLLQYSIAVDRLRIAMVLILKKLPTKTTLVSGF